MKGTVCDEFFQFLAGDFVINFNFNSFSETEILENFGGS